MLESNPSAWRGSAGKAGVLTPPLSFKLSRENPSAKLWGEALYLFK